MLVQALASYADTYLAEQLAELALEEKPVPFTVEINDVGEFINVRERTQEVTQANGKKIRIPLTLLVPRSPVSRVSGVYPLLGCDAIQYVVGPFPGVWTEDSEGAKHRAHHSAFVEFIRHAASETNDPSLKACVMFYADEARVAKARDALAEKKPKGGALVALVVRPRGLSQDEPGGPVIERPGVREFWCRHFNEKFAERHAEGGEAICLVTGKRGSVAVTHEKIKGTASLGGQPAGVSLMSFDKEAFRSYGWERNANSPVGPERAAAYVLALNDLLRRGDHQQTFPSGKLQRTRSDHGGVAFLYWTREPSDDSPMAVFEDPQPENVAGLLDAPRAGVPGATSITANEFFLLTVSGNGGRLVVRDWFHDSLPNVMANVGKWFEGIRIADVFNGGEPSRPPKLWELLLAISPPRLRLATESNDKVNAERAMRMVRRALHGLPLSRSVLAAALGRLRAESGNNRLSPARMGLVRLCVNDISKLEKGGESLMNESLDPNQEHPAYLCGCILAIYEALQYHAHQGEVNVTVADRYYGLASTYPQLAFPKLETLSKAHLKKLRRDNGPAGYAISKQIDELTDRLVAHGAKYPAQLNLEDQGRFAIGYHHQKAENARKAKEAKELKSAT